MKRMLASGLLMVVLAGGGLSPVYAQQTTAGDEAKKAGDSAKDAGKDAGDAAKHAGKATAKATKKTTRKVKKAVTGNAHATCVDGTRTEAKTEAAASAACSTHGGVAKR